MIAKYFDSRVSLLFLLVSVVVMTSCNKENNATAMLEVRLTDSPGDYQEVNIDIQDVQVNADDGNTSAGWKSLNLNNSNKGIYNLMKLTNGLDTLLGEAQLPVGKVSQLRLILGNNNSIKVAGQQRLLTTPSAQQSGLKVQVHADLKEGIIYKILIDFDAARSIVSTGNSKYILKPVIRTVVEAESGSVKGLVSPVASRPAVYALSGADTLATTFADSTSGKFLLKGLAARTYNVSLAPKSGYLPTTKADGSVTVGNVTDLGTVLITP